MTSKSTVINLTTIISTLGGLIGGAATGGFAAYTQLRTSQEQFSIDRAMMFKDLIGELGNEETARMALLNLWMLYPNERDQKIIVAAAIESGHPDLVETIIGFEEEVAQLAGILQAKAVLGEASALQTLTRIDPIRAARVMVDSIQNDLRLGGDRYFTNDMIHNLKRLAETNEKVVSIIRSKIEGLPQAPLLFDYLLYDAGADSKFVERVVNAYRERKELLLFNQFLAQANFKVDDAPKIFVSARGFVVDALRDGKSNQYRVAGALLGLGNNSFEDQRTYKNNKAFAMSLREAVESSNNLDVLRKKALTLLREISRREALSAIARALSENSASPRLKREIKQQLAGGLISSLEDEDPNFKGPSHCTDIDLGICIDDSVAWGNWLKE